MSSLSDMRVCLVVPNLESGGAERQVVYLANGLSASGFDVTLLSLSTHNPLREDLCDAVEFLTIPREDNGFLSSAMRMYRVFKRERFHAVQGFLFRPEILSRLAGRASGVPLIVGSERNSDYDINLLRKWLKKLTSSCMDVCIANSHAGAKYNQSLYGLPDSKYAVIYNAVDSNRFKPAPPCQTRQRKLELGLDPDKTTIGMFASLKPQKNHEALIAVAARLRDQRDIQYVVVGGELETGVRGSSEYARKIKAALDSSGVSDRVKYLGRIGDVENLYPCCDITVLPSWHEGLPNVILESAVSGVPVVASDVSDNGALMQLLDFGRLFPPDDPAQFATMIDVLLSAVEAGRYADLAQRTAEQMSIERMVQQFAAIFRSSHPSCQRERT